MTVEKRPFENIVGKGENAGNQHFLLFPQFFPTIFSIISSQKSSSGPLLFCRLQILPNWTGQKFRYLVNSYKPK